MDKEKLVVLLTRRFPYLPGEQFLEEEIVCWDKYFKGNILIIPSKSVGVSREMPKDVYVKRLDGRQSKRSKSFIVLKTLFSSLFIREIFFLLFRRKEVKYKLFKIAFLTSYRVLSFVSIYKRLLKERLKREVIIYSYWNSVESYAAAILRQKQNKYKIKLISRAHGFDVYEERRQFAYMPLKWQFKDSFDRVLAISEQGKFYLDKTYQMKNISVERLGVNISEGICASTDDGCLVVLSLSYCTPIKRVDRIIEAISAFKRANPRIEVTWHHIGDGIEMVNLKKMSEQLFNGQGIKWRFHGDKRNSEVHDFLKTNKVDVLLNTSESEGVPVSIMEAMSYGVPAIAPDVGGIRELVLPQNGILMSPSPSEQEIVFALQKGDFFKSEKIRMAAKEHIKTYYNSKENYRRVIDMIDNS